MQQQRRRHLPAWFHSELCCWQEIDAISGGALCVLHTSIVPLSLWHSTGLEWSKITRVLVEKKQEGGNIFLTTLATRVCPVLKLPDTRPLAGDLKKVEFTATTNGLNSQLSLDKLKTNSCSLSKKRGGQLFPSGQTVTGNHSLQQYNILNCLLDSVIFLNFVYHMELSEFNRNQYVWKNKTNKQFQLTILPSSKVNGPAHWRGAVFSFHPLLAIYNSTIGNEFYNGQHCIQSTILQ